MANTVNYAEVWQPELLEVIRQNTLCTPFITGSVRWLDAKTFHFTQMNVGGYKNHDRQGGWNRGSFSQVDVPFTVAHDRDIEFLVDKADVDESNAAASIRNISRTFTQTQASPEMDALFFSKVAAAANAQAGYHSATARADYTRANVYSKLKAMISAGKLRRYKAKGALVVYLASELMDLLEQSTDFTRSIDVTRIADGGEGIETRVTDIDGVPVMEVIDDETFYDAFNFAAAAGGFEPAASAHKLNAVVASPLTVKVVPKISSIYYFNPGAHTAGDGYLYQNRALSDVFVFPNGKDNKIDSVYADADTAAVTV